jgi:hypothetical protein
MKAKLPQSHLVSLSLASLELCFASFSFCFASFLFRFVWKPYPLPPPPSPPTLCTQNLFFHSYLSIEGIITYYTSKIM